MKKLIKNIRKQINFKDFEKVETDKKYEETDQNFEETDQKYEETDQF